VVAAAAAGAAASAGLHEAFEAATGDSLYVEIVSLATLELSGISPVVPLQVGNSTHPCSTVLSN